MPSSTRHGNKAGHAYFKIVQWLTGGVDPDATSPYWDTTSTGVRQYLKDNVASAYEFFEGANSYLKFVTTNSAEQVVFGKPIALAGTASFEGLRTSSASAAAITAARALTLADAGGVFSVSQAAAYDIDLPSPTTGPGCRYTFYLTAPGANNVTITVLGGAATFVGTIVNDVTSVIPATGSTLTFATGASILGDSIEIVSISTSLYLVRAVSSAASSITIA
jgi:hypothetical protein